LFSLDLLISIQYNKLIAKIKHARLDRKHGNATTAQAQVKKFEQMGWNRNKLGELALFVYS
jgi:hypothetical protein